MSRPDSSGSPSGQSTQPRVALVSARRRGPGRKVGIVAVGLVVALYGLTACAVGSSSMPQPAPPATATPPPPTPTQTPAPTVVFSDPLTSNANRWHEGNGCSFKSDGYHINADEICFAPVNTPADADISVQATQVSGSLQYGYGLVVRISPTNTSLNGYLFLIASAGAWTFIKAGSTETVIVPFTPTSAIHTGINATNTLEVRMQGSHFTFIINGTQMGQQVDDSTFTGNISGLVGNSHADVAFTNYTITVPHSTASGQTRFPSAYALPARLAALAEY
jgi:hypothetical protein